MKYPRNENSNKNTAIETSCLPEEVNGHIRIRRINNFLDKDRDRYFRILYVKEGVKSVKVDLEKIKSFVNLIVFVSPGQKLKIESDLNPVGWVFHFSKAYYNILMAEEAGIWSNNFISPDESIKKLVLSPEVGERIHAMAGMIDELTGSHIHGKANGIKSLLKAILVYCNCRCNVDLNDYQNLHEISLISRFEQLVNGNFSSIHMVSDYARMLNITPKYLNQVVKHILGITAKQVIQEQIMIIAKQELKFSNSSIKDIAQSLGFSDPYHFSSFFKEMAGISPLRYRER